MSDEPIRKLTPEEVEETNRQAAEYLKKLDAIEASGKTPINSPKFDGPIGLVETPENAPNDSDKSDPNSNQAA